MTLAVGTDAIVTEIIEALGFIIEALGFEVKHLKSVKIEFEANTFVVTTVERRAEDVELREVFDVISKYDITATLREEEEGPRTTIVRRVPLPGSG